MRKRWIAFLILMAGLVAPAISLRAQTGLFQGSANGGTATAEPLRLSLEDAQQRGLKYNLGALSANQDDRQAEAARQAALSLLMPNLNGNLMEKAQQIVDRVSEEQKTAESDWESYSHYQESAPPIPSSLAKIGRAHV